MAKLRVGIIGCGYWGANFVRLFHELPETSVAACSDLNPERLKLVRQRCPGAALSTDPADVIGNPKVDAVCIATDAKSHFKFAKAALEAGKHALVEKPFTATPEQAKTLIRRAKKNGLVLMVGHTYRFNAGVEALKERIDAGEMGDLLYFYTQRTNLGPVREDVNVLWDLAAHDVSILLHLTGALPVEVSAKGQSYIRKGVADIVFSDLRFPNNVIANVQASWLDPVKTRRVTAIGAEKMIVFDEMNPAEPIRIYDKGFTHSVGYDTFGEYQLLLREGDLTIPRIKRTEPLKDECRHFAECIQSGATPLTDGRNGLEVVRVLTALQRSLENNGQATPLKDV